MIGHSLWFRFLGILVLLMAISISVAMAQSNGSAGDEDAPLSQVFTRGQCQGEGDVWFTAAPADPAQLSHIFPLGLMAGSHVTPVDHQYYYWASHNVPLEAYPIVAPADGVVVQVDFMHDDYRIILEHSCDVFTIWIHLEKLAGPLAHLHGTLASNQHSFERIPVSAGDVIAFDGGTHGFDFSVHDQRVVLSGFLRPESYRAEPWKIHTVDPFDYFVDSVRGQLLEKNVRNVEPLGGRIDHDVPGTLLGNWFVEGTNGYAGASPVGGTVAPDQQIGYWSTHLAIAPDPIDPSVLFLSLGSYDGRTAQHAIGNPDPHPALVAPGSGIVKYELVGSQYIVASTGEPWAGILRAAAPDIFIEIYPQHVYGTVLLELLPGERLRVESFPGKREHEIEGFTDAALIYER